MKPFLVFLLVAAALVMVFVPLIPPSADTQVVDVHQTEGGVVLVGRGGQLSVALNPQESPSTYSSDNPFDLASQVMDPSRVQRMEILPYGGGTVCSVQLNTGSSVASKTSFCVALALRSDLPLYVHSQLLTVEGGLPKNL